MVRPIDLINKNDTPTSEVIEINNETEVHDNNERDTDTSERTEAPTNDIIRPDKLIHLEPAIPNGGWGWVTVGAAFLVLACADGLAFSFGLLKDEFIRNFKTSQSETSLIGSMFIATPLLDGPITTALVDRYGCRAMTIISSVLSALGFLLAAVSDSVATLFLTLGIISGLAIGILYVTAIVSVSFWFDKKRNLAVSLASCGIGFGILTYPAMINYFLDSYTLKNTLVLLAGILLNMCVCGALMINPEWMEIKQKGKKIFQDHHYLEDVPLKRNTMMRRGAMMTTPRYRLKMLSILPDKYENSMLPIESNNMKWSDRILQTIKKTFDYRMLTDVHFLLFNISSLITSMWSLVPFFFLTTYMTESNTAGGDTIISIIGLGSIIGILAVGWSGNQYWINIFETHAICTITTGVSIACFPLCIMRHWAVAVVSFIYGISFTSSYSCIAPILLDLVPDDRFSGAYGLTLFSQGIGHLIGPPIAGMIYDSTKNWNLTFYITGLLTLIPGIYFLTLAYTKKNISIDRFEEKEDGTQRNRI